MTDSTEVDTRADAPSKAEAIDAFMQRYEQTLKEGDMQYWQTHSKRFRQTLEWIEKTNKVGATAMEAGTYGMFMVALKELFGYEKVDGTIYEVNNPAAHVKRAYPYASGNEQYDLYNMDLERESLPLADESLDFILCCEVIEHFSIDPMAFLHEANRTLKMGGKILITTPNISCAENIFRICWRQVPNMYHQYRKALNTDRHNLEYGPDLLKRTLETAGFAVGRMDAKYSWTQPRPEIEKMLQENGFPTELRGDNLFFEAVKVSGPLERFPDFLYD